jgi:hypothetical protein
MLHRRLATAALAALFGLTATAATIGNAALHAPAAYADDEGDQGNQGEHGDNGKHNGWKKHHKHHRGDADGGGGYSNGGGYYGGKHYGNGGNGNCQAGGYGLQTLAGFERSGFNGSQFTLRQPLASGIPWQVGGTDYTVLVDATTCVQRSLGTYGEHVTVVGRPLGDGHTIQAVRITG